MTIHKLQDLCYAYRVAEPVREMLFALQDRIDALEAQRKPLTDEELMDAFCITPNIFQFVQAYKAGVRFAEAAHGIKDVT